MRLAIFETFAYFAKIAGAGANSCSKNIWRGDSLLSLVIMFRSQFNWTRFDLLTTRSRSRCSKPIAIHGERDKTLRGKFIRVDKGGTWGESFDVPTSQALTSRLRNSHHVRLSFPKVERSSRGSIYTKHLPNCFKVCGIVTWRLARTRAYGESVF